MQTQNSNGPLLQPRPYPRERLGEWRGGVSPPRSLRTGREPLGSSGSQYPAVGLVVQQRCLGHVAPPVTGWPPALGGIPQPLRSNSITEPSSLLRTAPSLCP